MMLYCLLCINVLVNSDGSNSVRCSMSVRLKAKIGVRVWISKYEHVQCPLEVMFEKKLVNIKLPQKWHFHVGLWLFFSQLLLCTCFEKWFCKTNFRKIIYAQIWFISFQSLKKEREEGRKSTFFKKLKCSHLFKVQLF